MPRARWLVDVEDMVDLTPGELAALFNEMARQFQDHPRYAGGRSALSRQLRTCANKAHSLVTASERRENEARRAMEASAAGDGA